MPLNACISLFIVTDAHSHVDNVNKIPHVNDYAFTVFLLSLEGFRALWLFI